MAFIKIIVINSIGILFKDEINKAKLMFFKGKNRIIFSLLTQNIITIPYTIL